MRAGLGAAILALAVAACGGGAQDERDDGRLFGSSANGSAAKAETAKADTAPAKAATAPTPADGAVSATGAPDPNTAQRAAIMDAVRPAIEQKLGAPVEFVVQRAAVQDGWALVIADPQRPGGGQIDPRRHFPHEVIEFMDGLTVNAILRFSGGGWTLVDHAIGPTDVWYCGVEGPPRSLTGC